MVEQLQDEALLSESRRLREQPDGLHLAIRKVAPQNVVKVGANGLQLVHEELLLRFEVAELERKMRGGRDGAHGTDRIGLDWAQLEVASSLILGEAWQAVEFLDFFGGKDREAPRLSRHARHTDVTR